jgi:hypothetical protein
MLRFLSKPFKRWAFNRAKRYTNYYIKKYNRKYIIKYLNKQRKIAELKNNKNHALLAGKINDIDLLKTIEDKLEIGDAVIFYGSIVHGVEKVVESKKLDWKSYNGRWFIGMFVNDSNHVKNRITANDLSNSTSFKKKAN